MSELLACFETKVRGHQFATHWAIKTLLPLLSFLLVTTSLVFVFLLVPAERVMGAVQRIFYFHVGAAMACYLAVGILLFGSCVYLIRRSDVWDWVAEAGAGVALVFATQVLITGIIWGHSAWNVWWRWEPRLVSFLLLWVLLVGYWLLRRLATAHVKQRTFSAVLGILIAVNVPIVVFSVKLLTAAEQLHPQVVANRGLKDPLYVVALVLSIVAMSSLALWMVTIAVQYSFLRQELETAEREDSVRGRAPSAETD